MSWIVEANRVAESTYPGDLGYKAFFLDDGVIAGKAPAVQLFLATLELLLREIGLEIARNKTEVAPLALPSRTSQLTTSRVAHGYPMATSNFLGRPPALRNGANPSWTDVWAKPGSCLKLSVATMIPMGPLPCHSLGRLAGSPLSDED